MPTAPPHATAARGDVVVLQRGGENPCPSPGPGKAARKASRLGRGQPLFESNRAKDEMRAVAALFEEIDQTALVLEEVDEADIAQPAAKRRRGGSGLSTVCVRGAIPESASSKRPATAATAPPGAQLTPARQLPAAASPSPHGCGKQLSPTPLRMLGLYPELGAEYAAYARALRPGLAPASMRDFVKLAEDSGASVAMRSRPRLHAGLFADITTQKPS